VLLAGLLFAPAVWLVWHGNLSVNDAMLRFGCALLAAGVGIALFLSALPGQPTSAEAPSGAPPATPATPAASGSPAAQAPGDAAAAKS
jgi:hypothetical protein